MTHVLPSLATALVIGLCAPLPVQGASPIAEVICEATPQMEARLSARMGSHRAAMGLRERDQMMELWTTPQGDWTLVVAYASGQSCIVAMGEAWQAGEETRRPEESY